MTTPPLLGLIGLALQRMRGARHFIWEMDVYPDIASELGVFREGGLVDCFVGWLADCPRRRADGVIVLGPCMAARIQRRGVDAARIYICHNWADGEAIQPMPFVEDGRLKVLYSGNFGLAHDFDTVVDALRILGKDAQFEFFFSGGGPQLRRLKMICEESGYTSCRFQGFQPRDALGALLAGCDVGLVTQKDGTEGAVVPSKTYGLMAAGRPIAYVGPDEATPAWLIKEHRAGWRVANGDVDGLVARLRTLRESPASYREAGRQARLAFERHYDRKLGVRRILKAIGIPSRRSDSSFQAH
jgi:glycosyltransferase involved in cell wall biosynthesis